MSKWYTISDNSDRSINYAQKVMSELSFMTFYFSWGLYGKGKNRFFL